MGFKYKVLFVLCTFIVVGIISCKKNETIFNSNTTVQLTEKKVENNSKNNEYVLIVYPEGRNIYQNYSADSKVLGKVKRDDIFPVFEKKSIVPSEGKVWYKISSNNTVGWITEYGKENRFYVSLFSPKNDEELNQFKEFIVISRLFYKDMGDFDSTCEPLHINITTSLFTHYGVQIRFTYSSGEEEFFKKIHRIENKKWKLENENVSFIMTRVNDEIKLEIVSDKNGKYEDTNFNGKIFKKDIHGGCKVDR